MFEKVQSLPLKSSVSAFNYAFVYHYDKPNDLHTIGCLDVDLVNLTRYKLTAAKTVEQVNCVQVKIDPIDEATQFCLIEFHSFKFLGLDLFCLISSNGLHVYDDIQLVKPIFTYSIKHNVDPLGSGDSAEQTFNGCACLDNNLFLGTSSGVVLVFEMHLINLNTQQQPAAKAIQFEFKELLKQHHFSITSINSQTDLVKDVDNQFIKVHRLSVADALGNISIWHLDGGQLKFILQFAGFNNYHCVATKFFEDLLIASYSSGHIRLFSLIDKCVLCEVSAHAKPISSMDICNETGLLITTSEDTFVRVWMLKPDNDSCIKQRYCYSIRNCLLVSGIFLGKDSRFFSAIAYDESEAFLFKRTSKL